MHSLAKLGDIVVCQYCDLQYFQTIIISGPALLGDFWSAGINPEVSGCNGLVSSDLTASYRRRGVELDGELDHLQGVSAGLATTRCDTAGNAGAHGQRLTTLCTRAVPVGVHSCVHCLSPLPTQLCLQGCYIVPCYNNAQYCIITQVNVLLMT